MHNYNGSMILVSKANSKPLSLFFHTNRKGSLRRSKIHSNKAQSHENLWLLTSQSFPTSLKFKTFSGSVAFWLIPIPHSSIDRSSISIWLEVMNAEITAPRHTRSLCSTNSFAFISPHPSPFYGFEALWSWSFAFISKSVGKTLVFLRRLILLPGFDFCFQRSADWQVKFYFIFQAFSQELIFSFFFFHPGFVHVISRASA